MIKSKKLISVLVFLSLTFICLNINFVHATTDWSSIVGSDLRNYLNAHPNISYYFNSYPPDLVNYTNIYYQNLINTNHSSYVVLSDIDIQNARNYAYLLNNASANFSSYNATNMLKNVAVRLALGMWIDNESRVNWSYNYYTRDQLASFFNPFNIWVNEFNSNYFLNSDPEGLYYNYTKNLTNSTRISTISDIINYVRYYNHGEPGQAKANTTIESLKEGLSTGCFGMVNILSDISYSLNILVIYGTAPEIATIGFGHSGIDWYNIGTMNHGDDIYDTSFNGLSGSQFVMNENYTYTYVLPEAQNFWYNPNTGTYDFSYYAYKWLSAMYLQYPIASSISFCKNSCNNDYNCCKKSLGSFPAITPNTLNYTINLNDSEISIMALNIIENRSLPDIFFEPLYPQDTIPDSPPVVSQDSPPNNYITNRTNAVFDCTGYDDYNLNNISLYINTTGTFKLNQTISASGLVKQNKFGLNLTNGTYKWSCQVCDNSSQCTFSNNQTLIVNSSYTQPITSLCYQENTNKYYPYDGDCNLNYSGSYSIPTNYFYINYSKTNLTINNAIWRVHHGNINEYNVSIPSNCINYNNQYLELRFYSYDAQSLGATEYSYGQCFNGTWINITSISTSTNQWGGDGDASGTLLSDGNWSTADYYSNNWYSSVQNNAASIYEEGIYWNVTNVFVDLMDNLNNNTNNTDTNPPTITLNSPTNNYNTNITSINFTCSATDDVQLSNISIYTNTTGTFKLNQSKSLIGVSNSTIFNITNLINGTYLWTCLACDNSSNCAFGNNQTFKVDTTSPQDTIYSTFSNYWDNNGTLLNNGTGKFNITISNTNGTVYLIINGSSIKATNLTNNVYNASYNFINYGVYSYYWSSYGNGTSNNLNNSNNYYYAVNQTIDNIYPIFYNNSDNSRTLIGNGLGNFYININNTNGSVYLNINGNSVKANNISNLYQANYTFSNYGSYIYNWTAYGNGSFNNLNYSNNYNYTINQTIYGLNGTIVNLKNDNISALYGDVQTEDTYLGELITPTVNFTLSNISIYLKKDGYANGNSANIWIDIVNYSNSSQVLATSNTLSSNSVSNGYNWYSFNFNYLMQNYNNYLIVLKTNESQVVFDAGDTNSIPNRGKMYYSWQLQEDNDLLYNLYGIQSNLDNVYPTFSNNLTNINSGSNYNKLNNYSFNITITNSSGTAFLSFNSIIYSMSNILNSFFVSIGNLASGTYNYFFYSYGNGTSSNYNQSINYTYLVSNSSDSCNILFNITSPQNYPYNFLVWSNCTSSFHLYRNGVQITNNSVQSLSAGTYNFTVNRDDIQNYTNIFDSKNFIINNFNSLCYQESANVSNQDGTDGSCGLNYSGSYYLSGNWVSNPSNIYDGNWSSYAFAGGTDLGFIVNYSKPINATNAYWNVSLMDGSYNSKYHYINLNNCWDTNSNKISLKWNVTYSSQISDFYCLNGSNWIYLDSDTGYIAFYEEGINWNITNINNIDNPPIVNLISADNQIAQGASQYFNAGFTDDINLFNDTFYIFNSSNKLIKNTTTLISGTSNETDMLYSLPYYDIFKWSFSVCDNSSQCVFSPNRTITYSCSPSLTNTSWSNWINLSCSNNQMNQSRNLTQYDLNLCGSNTTIYQYQSVNNFVNTSYGSWSNLTSCNGSYYTQVRNLTNYDIYSCGSNSTSYSYQNIACSLCVPNCLGKCGGESDGCSGTCDASCGGGGGDYTPPYFTSIPAFVNLFYGENLGVKFTATDNIGLLGYAVNDTNFNINSTGWLKNISSLNSGTYNINISIYDTSNNVNSVIYSFLVYTPNQGSLRWSWNSPSSIFNISTNSNLYLLNQGSKTNVYIWNLTSPKINGSITNPSILTNTYMNITLNTNSYINVQ